MSIDRPLADMPSGEFVMVLIAIGNMRDYLLAQDERPTGVQIIDASLTQQQIDLDAAERRLRRLRYGADNAENEIERLIQGVRR